MPTVTKPRTARRTPAWVLDRLRGRNEEVLRECADLDSEERRILDAIADALADALADELPTVALERQLAELRLRREALTHASRRIVEVRLPRAERAVEARRKDLVEKTLAPLYEKARGIGPRIEEHMCGLDAAVQDFDDVKNEIRRAIQSLQPGASLANNYVTEAHWIPMSLSRATRRMFGIAGQNQQHRIATARTASEWIEVLLARATGTATHSTTTARAAAGEDYIPLDDEQNAAA